MQGNNALKAFDDGVVRLTNHLATVGWGTAYNGFQRDLAGPMTAWLTVSLPHAIGLIGPSLAAGWSTAYENFQRDFAGKLTAWWTQSFPHALGNISTAFATAWGTSYNGFQRDFAGKLTASFTQSLPHAMGNIGDAFSTAWGTAYNGFQRDLAGPIVLGTQLLPKSMAARRSPPPGLLPGTGSTGILSPTSVTSSPRPCPTTSMVRAESWNSTSTGMSSGLSGT